MPETVTPGAGQVNSVVVFDKVKYDVIAGPDASTPLVQWVRTTALQTLEIDKLVTLLNRTDDLLFITSCGVAGLMHPTTQQPLSAQVMALQYKLRRNTGEIGLALLSFEESARNMLSALTGALKDLHSLHEPDAVTRLARCEPVATKMAESAGRLEANFQSLIEEAAAVLRLTSETCQRPPQEPMAAQQEPLGVSALEENLRAKRATLEQQMMKIRILDEEAKAAQSKLDARLLTPTIVSHVARALRGGKPGGWDLNRTLLEADSELAAALEKTTLTIPPAHKEEATQTSRQSARQTTDEATKEKDTTSAANDATEKSKYLDMLLMDLQQQERDVLAAIALNAQTLGAAQEPEEIEQAALVSLQHAVMALQQVAGILAENKRRLTQMATDGARLTQVDLRTDMEAGMKLSREHRIAAYSEPGFQVPMLLVAAQWLALQLVNSEFRSAIQAVYVKMGETYTKNPTIEEARQLAPLLGKTLAEEVDAEISLLNQCLEPMALEQQEPSAAKAQA